VPEEIVNHGRFHGECGGEQIVEMKSALHGEQDRQLNSDAQAAHGVEL